MQDPRTPEAMHAALRFVLASDIPFDHKAVLIETLTQALRDRDTADIRRAAAAAQASGQWQTHETEQLHTFLQGRVANSWQQADEISMQLAAQLHRHPHDIRAKATELGFGVAVDYRLAKARVQAGRD
jgi:hypothetical protein